MQHLSHSLWQMTGAQFVFKTLRQTSRDIHTHKDVGGGVLMRRKGQLGFVTDRSDNECFVYRCLNGDCMSPHNRHTQTHTAACHVTPVGCDWVWSAGHWRRAGSGGGDESPRRDESETVHSRGSICVDMRVCGVCVCVCESAAVWGGCSLNSNAVLFWNFFSMIAGRASVSEEEGAALFSITLSPAHSLSLIHSFVFPSSLLHNSSECLWGLC